MQEEATKRVGSIIRLKPEYRERYVILHKHTFPEVLARLRRSNIRNYSIFLRDDLLFSHFEYVGHRYEEDMNAIADPVTKEWWTLTDPMQDPFPWRKNGEWWAALDFFGHADGIRSESADLRRRAFTTLLPPGTTHSDIRFNAGLSDRLEEYAAQNCVVYFKEERLFVYFEQTGAGESDGSLLLQHVLSAGMPNAGFGSAPVLSWQEMKEVFHTQ